MNLYISNPVLDNYIAKCREKDKLRENELESISLNKSHSDNIHVILVDNYRHTTNKNTVVTTITNLVNTNEGDHVVIVMYGYTIRCFGHILPLKNPIIKLISKTIHVNFDGKSYYRKDDIHELVQSKAIMNEPELEFLNDYTNIFFYE